MLTITHHSTGTGAATKTIQYIGELIFENGILRDINHEFGRILANASNKYQYYLTDHLGSTRVVLQEDPAQFTSSATFETMAMEEESQQFLNYDEATRVSATVFDHTDSANSNYSIRLSGNKTGLAKSISVLPGDTVRMQVFAKYIEYKKAKSDPAIMAMLLSVANPAGLAGTGEIAGAITQPTPQTSFAGLLGSKKSDGNAPPAYLNYLFFDREMNYKYGGFVQMSEAASEDGSNVPHEELNQEVIAEEAGYFYIYLSSEGTTGDEAFFDDFTIQVSESFIVQTTDYYPYGMVAKRWLRTGERETKELFQGKSYEDLTKWYDFHARQYDAALGRWFAVDPQFLQFPHLSGYNAMMNNPLIYVDPDGEFPWLAVGIVAAIFGTTNVAIQAANGEIDNFWDGLSAFGSGALAGAAITAGVTTGLGVPILGTVIKGAGIVYGSTLALGTVSGLGQGIFGGDWNVLGNTWGQFAGNFYLDGNRNFFGQLFQGIGRFSWELPQSTIGHGYSQIRNAIGGVDRVDYFGGATWATAENRNNRNGVSIGNFININLRDQINGRFADRVINDPLFMHEYGHTFQSQLFGPFYLPVVGLPSLISAATSRRVPNEPPGVTTHDFRWYEMGANRHAARYFDRHYGIDWGVEPWRGRTFETFFPRRRR
ncbi:MAG: RHS repeat domain-containing protein [Cyclobacteriaceae bacterium]